MSVPSMEFELESLHEFEGESEFELESEFEFESEFELEGELEHEQFFGALAKLAKRGLQSPALRKIGMSGSTPPTATCSTKATISVPEAYEASVSGLSGGKVNSSSLNWSQIIL